MIRLHVEAPLRAGAELQGTARHAHSLGTVLRRGPGDALALFNGADGEWQAEIAALRKDRISFRLGPRLRPQAAEGGPVLVFAAVKREAMDLIAGKATELGAAALWPVISARSNVTRVGLERLRAIATEAAEQCGRLTVPMVAEVRPLASVIGDWPAGRTLVVADESGAAPPLAALLPAHAQTRLALLTGPEGGFEPAELDGLRRRPFVLAAGLGPRILRAETAAIAGLALIQALAGDWRG